MFESRKNRSFTPVIYSKVILILSMLFGFLSGLLFAGENAPVSFSWMRIAVPGSTSIARVLCVLLFPFLTVRVLLSVFKSVPVILFCFARFFCVALSLGSVTLAYGNSGWLMRWLFFFSSSLSLPAFILFCVRHLDGARRHVLQRDFWICLFWVFLVVTIDYYFVSPFLSALIE